MYPAPSLVVSLQKLDSLDIDRYTKDTLHSALIEIRWIRIQYLDKCGTVASNRWRWTRQKRKMNERASEREKGIIREKANILLLCHRSFAVH